MYSPGVRVHARVCLRDDGNGGVDDYDDRYGDWRSD